MANRKISDLTAISTPSLTGVTAVVNNGVTYKSTLQSLRNILVDSGSHIFTGSQTINGNLVVSGSVTAQQYILSSSVSNITIESISGSTNFGNSLDDTHNFTGSLKITGSSTLKGNQTISGSLYVTSSVVVGQGNLHEDEVLHVLQSPSSSYIAHFQGDSPYFAQLNITNKNSGNNASTDLVVTADNGDDIIHYIDLGINSSTYSGGFVGYENDSYLLNVGKDMYVGTIGGASHPSKLILFAENLWDTPQIVVSGSRQIGFNTSSVSSGYVYEFSGSVKMNHNLNLFNNLLVSGSETLYGRKTISGSSIDLDKRPQIEIYNSAFGSTATFGVGNGGFASFKSSHSHGTGEALIGSHDIPQVILHSETGSKLEMYDDKNFGHNFRIYGDEFSSGSLIQDFSPIIEDWDTAIVMGDYNNWNDGLLNIKRPLEVSGSVIVSGSGTFLQNQTVNGFMVLSQVSSSLNFVDDSAAGLGGVPLGGLYRSGSFVLIRLT